MGILELSAKFAAKKAEEDAMKRGKAKGIIKGIELALKAIELLKQKKSQSKIAKELDIDITLVKRIAAAIK